MSTWFLAFLFLFSHFITSSSAQSGGGGGTVSIFAASIFVVCCPCIVFAIIIIYIKSRCEASCERKHFFSNIYPDENTERLTPQSGPYEGHYDQDGSTHFMRMNLTFALASGANQPITIYNLFGEGSDSLGTFYLKDGECRIGSTAKLVFRKKYNASSSKADAGSMLYPLQYQGILDSGGAIRGSWMFVGESRNGYFLLQHAPYSENIPLITKPSTLPTPTFSETPGGYSETPGGYSEFTALVSTVAGEKNNLV